VAHLAQRQACIGRVQLERAGVGATSSSSAQLAALESRVSNTRPKRGGLRSRDSGYDEVSARQVLILPTVVEVRARRRIAGNFGR
jgi:hypothetical protein